MNELNLNNHVKNKKFEYKSVYILNDGDEDYIEDLFDNYGKEGWRFVTITTAFRYKQAPMAIFEREIL